MSSDPDLDIVFRHSIWHSIWHSAWYFLASCLRCILAFYLTLFLAFCHDIFFDSPSGILSDIHSRISSGSLFDIHPGSHLRYSGILFGILSRHSCWQPFWHSILHLFWHSSSHSGCDVRAQACPTASRAGDIVFVAIERTASGAAGMGFGCRHAPQHLEAKSSRSKAGGVSEGVGEGGEKYFLFEWSSPCDMLFWHFFWHTILFASGWWNPLLSNWDLVWRGGVAPIRGGLVRTTGGLLVFESGGAWWCSSIDNSHITTSTGQGGGGSFKDRTL